MSPREAEARSTASDFEGGATCRFCGAALRDVFVDLGMSPLCQTHIERHQLNRMEPFYPLRVLLCRSCLLVQLEEFVAPDEIFSEYAYFSSYSDSWVEHAREYVESVSSRFGLDSRHRVVEIASNDGYLLQHFVARGVPVLGIEPAANVARAAVAKGVPTVTEFFGVESVGRIVAEHGKADLVIGNNVLAHVPDLNGFVSSLGRLMTEHGVLTMEFPHLVRLVKENQFDTIYHEHFSYFTLSTAERVFAAHDLVIFDVEELSTHGGSLRIFVRHRHDTSKEATSRVSELRERERALGFEEPEGYGGFQEQVKETKRALLEFLIGVKREGRSVAGYGAPGKGNTLLNYCGIRQDFLDYTVDRSPYKQGKYTPGTHIPIHSPGRIGETRPDYILILPWNLKQEIVESMAFVREWGGRFVVPIPKVQVLD